MLLLPINFQDIHNNSISFCLTKTLHSVSQRKQHPKLKPCTTALLAIEAFALFRNEVDQNPEPEMSVGAPFRCENKQSHKTSDVITCTIQFIFSSSWAPENVNVYISRQVFVPRCVCVCEHRLLTTMMIQNL